MLLAIQLHFSLSSPVHATFPHTPPVMLGLRRYCNRDSPRRKFEKPLPPPLPSLIYDSCNRLIIARAFAERWRMLRGFTSELAFIQRPLFSDPGLRPILSTFLLPPSPSLSFFAREFLKFSLDSKSIIIIINIIIYGHYI